ncbi:hypothetical protein D3C87_175910 [compost metagenome]
MESITSRWSLIALLMISFSISAPAAAQSLCAVPFKSSLTMDERDDLRLKCLKRSKAKLNIPRCLKIANQMEYATNAEEARQVCLFELKKAPTSKECLLVTRAMEFPDSGDEARWSCLLRIKQVRAKKECMALAQGMQYPANLQRAEFYCDSELR